MQTSDTSLLAYEAIKGTLAERQLDVLKIIREAHNPLTAVEIAHWYCMKHRVPMDANRARPRVTELYHKGLIEPAGRRICTISGSMAHTWRVVTNNPQKELDL